jgi:hypothetical protein
MQRKAREQIAKDTINLMGSISSEVAGTSPKPQEIPKGRGGIHISSNRVVS